MNYKGRKVKLDETNAKLEVTIDDKKVPVVKKETGYSIFYSSGKTLEEAVKAFVDTQTKTPK